MGQFSRAGDHYPAEPGDYRCEKKAAELGLTAGIKCSSIGRPEDHKGCLCNRAIDENKSVHVAYEGSQGKAYGFWTPITERPEWILHFSVGRVAEYQEIKR